MSISSKGHKSCRGSYMWTGKMLFSVRGALKGIASGVPQTGL